MHIPPLHHPFCEGPYLSSTVRRNFKRADTSFDTLYGSSLRKEEENGDCEEGVQGTHCEAGKDCLESLVLDCW